jgi:protein TonB
MGGIIYGLVDPRHESRPFVPPARPPRVELLPFDSSAVPLARAWTHPTRSVPPLAKAGPGRLPGPARPLTKRGSAVPDEIATAVADPAITIAAPATAGRGLAGAADFQAYQRALYVALADHSRYPAEARRAHLSGITELAFRVDRGGTVLESWIQKSSGSDILDGAALQALARAQPLPPIPAALPGQLDFVIEIDLSMLPQAAEQTGG